MAKNKLYRLLATFSKRELQDFRLFLLSPYHNQSQIILALFDYIRDAHPNFNDKKLSYELIFNSLNQKRIEIFETQKETGKRKPVKVLKNTPDKYVNDRMHDLYNRLESFLAVRYLKDNKQVKEGLIIKALLKQECQEIYLSKKRKTVDKISVKPTMGYEENFELWTLYQTILSDPKTQRFRVKDDLSNADKYLDETYALLKLHYGLYELLKKSIFIDEVVSLPPSLKAIASQYASSESPVFQLYICAIGVLNSNDKEEAWKELRALYSKYIKVLPPSERLTFLIVLVNFGNKLAKQKNPSYFDEILLLYQEAIAHKFWEFSGVIPSITFKNIVALGISKKQFSWTSEFIHNYKQLLPEKDEAITTTFAKASLYFCGKNFEEAINELLGEIWQSNLLKELHDKLSYRLLYIKCLYELEHQSLASFRSAFNNFIKGQQLNKATKDHYRNLIYFVGYLDKQRAKRKRYRKSKEEMLAKLEMRSPCAAIDWVKEKIEEL